MLLCMAEPHEQNGSQDPGLATLSRVGWLHFYQMRHLVTESRIPRVLVRGDGIHVWDNRGQQFIDGLSGSYCVNVGYGRSRILERTRAASEALHYASPFLASHPTAIELAAKLSSLAAPALGEGARVFFVNSGSEAIDAALKMARAYHRQRGKDAYRCISRNCSYHGTTLGALAASGFTPMREGFEPLPLGFEHTVHTLCSRCELSLDPATCNLACASLLTDRLGGDKPRIGAVLIEPFQNCGGNIPPPPGYLEAVSARGRAAAHTLCS